MVAKWGQGIRRKKSTRDLKKEGSKWGWINSKGRSSWHPWKHFFFLHWKAVMSLEMAWWVYWAVGVVERFKRGLNERHRKAQRSSDANCFYSQSSSLPACDFSISNDLPVLLSLPHPSLYPSPCLPHPFFLPSLSCFLPQVPLLPSQVSFHRLLPI